MTFSVPVLGTKGMMFTSMITPVILIVLYATFLAKVFSGLYETDVFYKIGS